MAHKAAHGRMPHLLIDRFRFDSFAEEEGGEEGVRLLTRFGAVVYMFFMITPPIATVERAWQRGLEVGRYKAVDDLLDHNIEAYTGMPRLFFTWALRQDKQVHYEFLDNSVAAGERPRTVAFGWNDAMTILDIGRLLDVERFRKINTAATCPADVHPDPAALAAERNTGFLLQCARMIRRIDLADHRSGRIYARIEEGAVESDRSRWPGGGHGRSRYQGGPPGAGTGDPHRPGLVEAALAGCAGTDPHRGQLGRCRPQDGSTSLISNSLGQCLPVTSSRSPAAS